MSLQGATSQALVQHWVAWCIFQFPRLTDQDTAHLATFFSPQTLETLALTHFGISYLCKKLLKSNKLFTLKFALESFFWRSPCIATISLFVYVCTYMYLFSSCWVDLCHPATTSCSHLLALLWKFSISQCVKCMWNWKKNLPKEDHAPHPPYLTLDLADTDLILMDLDSGVGNCGVLDPAPFCCLSVFCVSIGLWVTSVAMTSWRQHSPHEGLKCRPFYHLSFIRVILWTQDYRHGPTKKLQLMLYVSSELFVILSGMSRCSCERFKQPTADVCVELQILKKIARLFCVIIFHEK